TKGGECLVNKTTEVAALVGDFQGHPVPNVRVSFFVARGRGILDAEAVTDINGQAKATFHSLCPANAAEQIVMVALVRGQEPFTDLNSNGVHDVNEPFVDLPTESFLDANQDGIFEPDQ